MINLILYAIPYFIILLLVEMLLLRHVHHHPEDEDEALDLAMGVEGPIGYEKSDTQTSIAMGLRQSGHQRGLEARAGLPDSLPRSTK